MYKVYKMKLDCGRQGDIESVIIADQEMIEQVELFKRVNPELNAYEELGKHSDIYFDFNDIEIIGFDITKDVAMLLDSIDISTGFDFILQGASAMLGDVVPKIEEYLTKHDLDISLYDEPLERFDSIVDEMKLDMTGRELRLVVRNGEY